MLMHLRQGTLPASSTVIPGSLYPHRTVPLIWLVSGATLSKCFRHFSWRLLVCRHRDWPFNSRVPDVRSGRLLSLQEAADLFQSYNFVSSWLYWSFRLQFRGFRCAYFLIPRFLRRRLTSLIQNTNFKFLLDRLETVYGSEHPLHCHYPPWQSPP